MAKATRKNAPVGKQPKGVQGGKRAVGLPGLHKGGKTVPTFQSERIAGMEGKSPKDKSIKS